MTYNYYFDIASLIGVFFLFAVYIMRKTYRTKANLFFVFLLVDNFFSAFFDYISCFSICYPERYPMWYNYLTTLGYLFAYNMMGLLFYRYMDAKTKIGLVQKFSKILTVLVIGVEGFLIWSSPLTHAVAYYDKNGIYSHGPFLALLYVVAALLLVMSTVLFVLRRRKFNRYQVLALTAFVVVVFLGVLIQMLFPSLLVGNFGCTLVLFFIYVSLENPVYYTFISTTCYNRQAFLETIRRRNYAEKNSNLLAFIIRDYDNVRENLGLRDMERLSSTIAEYINSVFGNNAFCIANDKYVIFMDDIEDEEYVRTSLQAYFSKPVALAYSNIMVTVNMVILENISSSVKVDLFEKGVCLLLEKSEASVTYEENFDKVVDGLKRKRMISRVLRDAIVQDSFEVYYQPIRDTRTDTFASVEALLRLQDKECGFISPEEFIPIAESEGLILQIGEIVFEKVCRFIEESKCIQKLGVSYIEINLSPLQCFQEDLVERFSNIMAKYEINPAWINLEITETASFEKDDRMVHNMNALHQMGITFSLDDFGSGFASIDYLFKLPVDIVKIDKSILWTAMKDPNAKIILLNTLKMVKELGKEIVVEGVEDEEMVHLLEENHCDHMQGYYYSKPIPGQAYVAFLEEHHVVVK